jgi:hypothetical protein
MRFEALPAVKKSMLIFWVVTSCGLVGRYQRFGGTYCLHLQGWHYLGVTDQKTNIDDNIFRSL